MDLAGAPETRFCTVVRMTATTSFLREPKPCHDTHNAVSPQFVTTPTNLGTAMLLCETVASIALQMAVASRRFGHTHWAYGSAFNVASIHWSPSPVREGKCHSANGLLSLAVGQMTLAQTLRTFSIAVTGPVLEMRR